MPEDDPEFQGLLENDDEALYPDIGAELLGVALEIEECDFTPVTDKPEENFRNLDGAVLHNAGIDAEQRICAALAANNKPRAQAIIEADNNKTLYELMFVLPNAGLPIANDPDANLGNQNNDTIVPTIVADNTDAQNPPSPMPVLTQSNGFALLLPPITGPAPQPLLKPATTLFFPTRGYPLPMILMPIWATKTMIRLFLPSLLTIPMRKTHRHVTQHKLAGV